MRKMSVFVALPLAVAVLVAAAFCVATTATADAVFAAPASDEPLDYSLVAPSSADFFPIENAKYVAASSGYIAIFHEGTTSAENAVTVFDREDNSFLTVGAPYDNVAGIWLSADTALVACSSGGSTYDAFYSADLSVAAPTFAPEDFTVTGVAYIASDDNYFYLKSLTELSVYNSDLSVYREKITHQNAISGKSVFAAENLSIFVFAVEFGARNYYVYNVEGNEATAYPNDLIPYRAANAGAGIFVSYDDSEGGVTLGVVSKTDGSKLFDTDIPCTKDTVFTACGDALYVVDGGGVKVYTVDWAAKTVTLSAELSMRGSSQGKFDSPAGILVSDGSMLVADSGNNRVAVYNGTSAVEYVTGASVSRIAYYGGRYVAVGESGVYHLDGGGLSPFAAAANIVAAGEKPVDVITSGGNLYVLTENSLYRLNALSFTRIKSGFSDALAIEASPRGNYLFVMTAGGMHTLTADGTELRAFRAYDFEGASDFAVDYAGDFYVSFPAENKISVIENGLDSLTETRSCTLADKGYPAAPVAVALDGEDLLFSSESCFVGRAPIGAVTEETYTPPTAPAIDENTSTSFALTSSDAEMFTDLDRFDTVTSVPAGTTVLVFENVSAVDGYVYVYANRSVGYVSETALAPTAPSATQGVYDLAADTVLRTFPHLGGISSGNTTIRIESFDDAAGLDGGAWARVEIDGAVRYVPRSALQEYVVVVPEREKQFGRAVGTRIGGIVELHSAPAETSAVIATVVDGTRMEILEESGDWYYVLCEDTYGYILKEEVELEGLTPVQIAAIVLAVVVVAVGIGVLVVTAQTRKKQKES